MAAAVCARTAGCAAAVGARMASSRAGVPALQDFGFALDIDGVLLRGKHAIPGAADAMRLLPKHHVP